MVAMIAWKDVAWMSQPILKPKLKVAEIVDAALPLIDDLAPKREPLGFHVPTLQEWVLEDYYRQPCSSHATRTKRFPK